MQTSSQAPHRSEMAHAVSQSSWHHICQDMAEGCSDGFRVPPTRKRSLGFLTRALVFCSFLITNPCITARRNVDRCIARRVARRASSICRLASRIARRAFFLFPNSCTNRLRRLAHRTPSAASRAPRRMPHRASKLASRTPAAAPRAASYISLRTPSTP